MRNIAITTRHQLSETLQIKLIDMLNELKGNNLFFTPRTKNHALIKSNSKYKNIKTLTKENISEMDIFIFFGGDGTILKAIYDYAPEIFDIPIFGVNAGNIGFFSSTTPNPKEYKKSIKQLLENNIYIDSRMVIKCMVYNENNECINTSYALNEITMHYSNLARIQSINTFVSSTFLAEYKADGLIISTPTGSTAYNLAGGGPIVSPEIHGFIITPLAPIGFSQKPIVIPSHENIKLQAKENMTLSIDSQSYKKIKNTDTIIIKSYDKPINFIRLNSENYYTTIKEKLGWGKI
jgi:NAD+ kinase